MFILTFDCKCIYTSIFVLPPGNMIAPKRTKCLKSGQVRFLGRWFLDTPNGKHTLYEIWTKKLDLLNEKML